MLQIWSRRSPHPPGPAGCDAPRAQHGRRAPRKRKQATPAAERFVSFSNAFRCAGQNPAACCEHGRVMGSRSRHGPKSRLRRRLPAPRPVSVGVCTVCPAARSRVATRDQHHPPCHAPCTSTKVRDGPAACTLWPEARTSAGRAALAIKFLRFICLRGLLRETSCPHAARRCQRGCQRSRTRRHPSLGPGLRQGRT